MLSAEAVDAPSLEVFEVRLEGTWSSGSCLAQIVFEGPFQLKPCCESLIP